MLAGPASTAVVVGRCGCAPPTIDLETDMDADAVDAGRLHRLELVYYGDPPTAWPPPGSLAASTPRVT